MCGTVPGGPAPGEYPHSEGEQGSWPTPAQGGAPLAWLVHWGTKARSWTPTLISFWQSFSPEVKAGGAQRPGNARPLLTHSPLTWRCRESSVQGAQGSLWIRAWRESLLPPAAILAQLGKLQSQIRVGGNLSSPPLADR